MQNTPNSGWQGKDDSLPPKPFLPGQFGMGYIFQDASEVEEVRQKIADRAGFWAKDAEKFVTEFHESHKDILEPQLAPELRADRGQMTVFVNIFINNFEDVIKSICEELNIDYFTFTIALENMANITAGDKAILEKIAKDEIDDHGLYSAIEKLVSEVLKALPTSQPNSLSWSLPLIREILGSIGGNAGMINMYRGSGDLV